MPRASHTQKHRVASSEKERERSHSESLACVRAVTEKLTYLQFRGTTTREHFQNGVGSAAHMSRADMLPPDLFVDHSKPFLTSANVTASSASCA